jgi:hypothetical protein
LTETVSESPILDAHRVQPVPRSVVQPAVQMD